MASVDVCGRETDWTQRTYPEGYELKPRLSPCDFTLHKKLGRGGFGEVFVGSSISGELVALKRISKNNKQFNKTMVFREIRAGQLLKNKGITEFKTFFETVENVYLVYELLRGVDLHTMMTRRKFDPLQEEEIRQIMKQVTVAVLYCHQQGICHRDLKWENLFLTKDGTIKLIDFGLASDVILPNEMCYDFVGSEKFAAPEVLARKVYSGFKADVYSCGKILFGLIFGTLEIDRLDSSTIVWPDRTNPNFSNFVSRTVKDLMSMMLEVDPCKRISLEEVCQHRWLQEDL